MTEPDPKKQSIIKAPSRAVTKARSNMASRALASVQVKTNSIGMKLKLIPAGEFLMGSPESEPEREENELQHRVRITRPFYLGIHTVTQSQWMAVMGTEQRADDYVKQGSDYPATCVSHDDAVDFCRKLSVRENATYRLPTEAEWEYTCRARSSATYSFGDTADQLEQYAWFDENADEVGEGYAHRGGQKLPNSFGLYDMHGNVEEWCSDWYGEYPSGEVTDPTGPAEGSRRVFRGGSWFCPAKHCRSAYRHGCAPSYRDFFKGFRVSLSPSGK
jgi:formylglycine-generating enzyme required for sulfatase activity